MPQQSDAKLFVGIGRRVRYDRVFVPTSVACVLFSALAIFFAVSGEMKLAQGFGIVAAIFGALAFAVIMLFLRRDD